MHKNDIETHDQTLMDSLMMDYAAGNLSCAQILVVDTYLEMNPHIRPKSIECLDIGGMFLEKECDQSTLSKGCYDQILQKIQNATIDENKSSDDKDALSHYMNADMSCVKWKNLSRGIEYFDIPVPCQKREKARLMKIAPGQSVFEHSHKGMELTLVLQGAFHDGHGHYKRGDLAIENDDHVAHHPTADKDMGCICISVISNPLKFKNIFVRLIGYFRQ